jgi:methyltransferase (TIGR00027 family)
MFVSAARGMVRGELRRAENVLDPFAKRLLPAPVGLVVGALGALVGTPLERPLAELTSFGMVRHVELRTLAIDRAMRAFLSSARDPQVVLLGAGADARAYRLTELAEVPVFEVDHPSTQVEKKRRVAASPARFATRAELTYVPVDFERDSLHDALLEAGFDRTRATFVLWEGVTMYLTREAARATLEVLRGLLTPEGRLAVTYALPELSPLPSRTRPFARAMFALVGEPLRGLYSPAELAALLVETGFDEPTDTGSTDWSRETGRPAPRLPFLERLAVTGISNESAGGS